MDITSYFFELKDIIQGYSHSIASKWLSAAGLSVFQKVSGARPTVMYFVHTITWPE